MKGKKLFCWNINEAGSSLTKNTALLCANDSVENENWFQTLFQIIYLMNLSCWWLIGRENWFENWQYWSFSDIFHQFVFFVYFVFLTSRNMYFSGETMIDWKKRTGSRTDSIGPFQTYLTDLDRVQTIQTLPNLCLCFLHNCFLHIWFFIYDWFDFFIFDFCYFDWLVFLIFALLTFDWFNSSSNSCLCFLNHRLHF